VQNKIRNGTHPSSAPSQKRGTQNAEGGERSAHTKALIHKKDYKWLNTEPYVEPFEGIATKTLRYIFTGFHDCGILTIVVQKMTAAAAETASVAAKVFSEEEVAKVKNYTSLRKRIFTSSLERSKI
jgi:hypothetical protein